MPSIAASSSDSASRYCRTCGNELAPDEYRSPRKVKGVQTWKCDACIKQSNIIKFLEPTTISRKRPADIYWRYGLTSEEVDAMRVSQGGVCAICKRPPTDKVLCIDHNHTTGKVRALLCKRCNSLVGYIEKSPDLVALIQAYLDHHT